MAWIHPVPSAMIAAHWATQDTPVLTQRTLLLQSGRVFLSGMRKCLCGNLPTLWCQLHVVADCLD